MTDNDIIKALECCSDQMYSCTDKQCKAKTLGNALDLINRQKAEKSNLTSHLTSLQNDLTSAKAEVERLTDTLNATINGQETLQRYITTAKAETIREFAERLKAEMLKSKYAVIASPYARACNAVIDFWTEEIEILVKEVVVGNSL